MISAITTGYRKGIATIIDANVITLLTAFILFGLATAGVKGFAFTLGIGTIVSLLTAVVFTRAVLGLLGRTRMLRSPSFLGAGEERVRWHFDFAGASKWFFSISGAILLIGAFSFATKQLNFGIDFESGAKVDVALAEDVSADDVRESLSDGRRRGPGLVQDPGGREPDVRRRTSSRSRARSTPTRRGVIQGQFDEDFGYESERRGGLPEPGRRPDVRPADRQERRLRDHLLAAPDRRLRRLPLRGQVRGPGDDRRHPRHPDHGRRLLAGRPGGDCERDRGRLPDDPRIFALRHRDRVRPRARERAAPAARDVRPDRQPLAGRGPHPVADHRPLDGLPDRA